MPLEVSRLTATPDTLQRPKGTVTATIHVEVLSGNPQVRLRYWFEDDTPLDFCPAKEKRFPGRAIPPGGITLAHSLTCCIPAGTQAGLYRLRLTVLQADNGTVLDERNRSTMLQVLSNTTIRRRRSP